MATTELYPQLKLTLTLTLTLNQVHRESEQPNVVHDLRIFANHAAFQVSEYVHARVACAHMRRQARKQVAPADGAAFPAYVFPPRRTRTSPTPSSLPPSRPGSITTTRASRSPGSSTTLSPRRATTAFVRARSKTGPCALASTNSPLASRGRCWARCRTWTKSSCVAISQ